MTKQEWFDFINYAREVKHPPEELEAMWTAKCNMHNTPITAPMVTPDIQPYRSTVTGELIGSRSKHRNHLREHNLVELGNEKVKPKQRMPDVAGRKEAIIEACRKHKVRGFH